jgi:N utilization substance protein B
MGSRRKGRLLDFQALFSWSVLNSEASSGGGMVSCDLRELLLFPWLTPEELEKNSEDSLNFARLLTAGALEKLDDVDAEIKAQLEHWDFDRLARVDLAVLRISVFALKYQTDIPASVTIDEAVDIAKIYGGDESYRFVNGVLDGIKKRFDEKK